MVQLGQGAPLRSAPSEEPRLPKPADSETNPCDRLCIGVVQDKAFGFYYPDDLLALQTAGAELVPVNALQDTALPTLDGLFIGGGFPEVFMAELHANVGLRQSIHAAIEADLPVYAECGGLMYLARTLRWKDQVADMVGALPVDVRMHERPVGRGYVRLQTTAQAPWLDANNPPGQTLHGHEFHYSSLENVPADMTYAYQVQRGHGIDGAQDGLVYRNVLASYAHLRSGAGSDWASQFVGFVAKVRSARQTRLSGAVRTLLIGGQAIATDVEGYLKNLDDWSEDFARAQAQAESLTLTDAHWQVIAYLRAYYDEHRVQAQVRAMIWHFAKIWGPELGNNHHLHALFPVGGPQKQGNRLAGLLKTKGEH
jgi:TusE/DsrC/DsvC family sulfur relay protein